MSIVSLIVATSQNNIIGVKNKLPWHLPKDLAYFKKTTLGNPVIMGRKTYESIGKALSGRTNIVVSRNDNYFLDDATVVSSLSDAISFAKKRIIENSEIFIIGGASIFLEAINTNGLVNKIYLNIILADFDGDAFFPKIKWEDWKIISKEKHLADNKNIYDIDFEVYIKNERI